MKKFSPSLISTLVFFILWEILGRYIGMLFILPWPTAILKKIYELREPLFKQHLFATLEVAFISIFISFILGGILAILMDKNEYIELFKSMKATEWQIFTKLKVPTTIPYFFSALKMSIPLVLIGAAIGEWLGANAGLGYFSKRMMTQLDGAGVFAPIVLISIIAIIFVKLISIFEKNIRRK